MSQSKVAFVLVMGSFAPHTFYHKVTSILTSTGHVVKETPLLSTNSSRAEGPATMAEDAASIHAAILSLLDSGYNVVLGLNSYAGFPGTEAVKGLSKAEREASGHPETALVGLVYLASFVPPMGTSIRDVMYNMPDGFKREPERDYMDLDPGSGQYSFNPLPPDEIEKYASQMGRHSSVSFDGKVTYLGYRHVPTFSMVTEQDFIIPPKMQHDLIDEANQLSEKEGFPTIKRISVDTGHGPMLTVPEKVVDLLLEAAGEK